MQAMINIALRAARSAAEALLQTGDRLDRIKIVNDDPLDFISSADQDSEATILYHLQKAFPSHSFNTRLGEQIQGEEHEPTWLVDPLVGSFNFSRGSDRYGIAIACKIDNNLSHSVVLLPVMNEEFTASRGNGAQLNNRRIRVNDNKDEKHAVIVLDAEGVNPGQLANIMQKFGDSQDSVRMTGSSAIDMAFTAAGRFSAGWCINRDSIAQQAATLLLTEAGALVGSETGSPDTANASELIYATPKTFKEFVKIRQSD